MEEVHRRHVGDVERMASDLESCRLEVKRLEIERPQLSERYHYFQVTRGYVHDLVDCLTTKVNQPSIYLCRRLFNNILLISVLRSRKIGETLGDSARQTTLLFEGAAARGRSG